MKHFINQYYLKKDFYLYLHLLLLNNNLVLRYSRRFLITFRRVLSNSNFVMILSWIVCEWRRIYYFFMKRIRAFLSNNSWSFPAETSMIYIIYIWCQCKVLQSCQFFPFFSWLTKPAVYPVVANAWELLGSFSFRA